MAGGRRSDGKLSTRPKAIRRRREYAAAKVVAMRVAGSGETATGGVLVAEEIGVFGARERKPVPNNGESAQEQPSQEYHCNDCKSPVPMGSKVCPICEREVIWP
jgi:hypothetical protein